MLDEKFWQNKSLEQMNDEEWEAVCDGCAKCCLSKFEDEDTGELHFSNVACQLLDTKRCHCTKYEERTVLVPECVKVSKENIQDLYFMPPSCSYRRLKEGRGLPSWHPLLHGGKKSEMHKANMSIRNKTVCETKAGYFEDHIVIWPLQDAD